MLTSFALASESIGISVLILDLDDFRVKPVSQLPQRIAEFVEQGGPAGLHQLAPRFG